MRSTMITIHSVWAIFIGIYRIAIHNCSNIIMLSSKRLTQFRCFMKINHYKMAKIRSIILMRMKFYSKGQIYNLLLMKKEKARPKQVYMQRIKCDCMAQKHELINNCLSCGKIVCAQEGEGNCLYCGKLVVRPDGMFIDDSETLFPSLSKDEQKNAAIERSKAIQHKNKLVERGKTMGQNQNIFDQQVDYYQISENKWLDEGDRKKAIERILQKDQMVQDESRKVNIKFDHVSGQFVREQFKFDEDQFRKEGRTFLQQKQLEQKLEKEKEIKVKHNWDERILRSEKMKDLCEQMLPKQGKRVTNQTIKRNQLATTGIILQKQ